MTANRIVVGGFEHETNTFAPTRADFHAFELGGGWPGLASGYPMLDAIQGANIPAAGFVAAARDAGHTIIPTTWCAASPSAQVTRDAYERIASLLLQQIHSALPADAVYLDLHGAMVCEHLDDGDGELIRRVRALAGDAVPLVVSLDLHANVTQLMLEQADALVAFRTYPHVDMAETGARTFAYLQQRLQGMPRQRPVWRRIPFLIPICWQSTMQSPARDLYQELAQRERQRAVQSLSLTMGFPAADFPECGGVVWGYGTDEAAVTAAVEQLAERMDDAETSFAGPLYGPADAVREAQRICNGGGAPVVIADAQDNPGAGGDSDTTGMLRALVESGARNAAIGLIVDPQAARAAHAAGLNGALRIPLGGKSGVPGDEPLLVNAIVEHLSDGEFTTHGPYYSGFRMKLGPSACLRVGGTRVVVSTNKAQMADLDMFRFVGIEPAVQSMLMVKSAVHFRAHFSTISDHMLVAIAPGAMKMDLTLLPWKRLAPTRRLMPGGPGFQQWRRGGQQEL